MSPTLDSPSSSSSESKPTAPPFSSLFQSGYGEHPSEIPPSDSDDPDSPYFNEISGTSAGAISAAVISALAFIFFVAAGYMIYSRRRRARIVPTAAGSEMLGPHSAHHAGSSPSSSVDSAHKPNTGVSRAEASSSHNPPPPYTRAPAAGTATVAVAGDSVEGIEPVELPTLHWNQPRETEPTSTPPGYSSVQV